MNNYTFEKIIEVKNLHSWHPLKDYLFYQNNFSHMLSLSNKAKYDFSRGGMNFDKLRFFENTVFINDINRIPSHSIKDNDISYDTEWRFLDRIKDFEVFPKNRLAVGFENKIVLVDETQCQREVYRGEWQEMQTSYNFVFVQNVNKIIRKSMLED